MNWLDLFIVICAGIGMIKGLFDGLVRQVISLISLVAAIIFAGKVSSFLYEFLSSIVPAVKEMPQYIAVVIFYILAFSVIIFLFHLLAKFIENIVKLTPVSIFNYLFGGILGALSAIVLLSLIFNLLIIIDPNSNLISKQTKTESVLFGKVRIVLPAIYPSLKKYINETERVNQLFTYGVPYDHDIKINV